MNDKLEKCGVFEKCSCPVCPMLKDIVQALWFPTEDICTKFNNSYIKQQKKIQKRIQEKNLDSVFTFRMLNKKIIIGKAIKGLDPDTEDMKEAETAWLNKHIEKRELSEAELEALKYRFNEKKRQSAGRFDRQAG
jgi:hypothetical protein